jgi:hypothetical protein
MTVLGSWPQKLDRFAWLVPVESQLGEPDGRVGIAEFGAAAEGRFGFSQVAPRSQGITENPVGSNIAEFLGASDGNLGALEVILIEQDPDFLAGGEGITRCRSIP